MGQLGQQKPPARPYGPPACHQGPPDERTRLPIPRCPARPWRCDGAGRALALSPPGCPGSRFPAPARKLPACAPALLRARCAATASRACHAHLQQDPPHRILGHALASVALRHPSRAAAPEQTRRVAAALGCECQSGRVRRVRRCQIHTLTSCATLPLEAYSMMMLSLSSLSARVHAGAGRLLRVACRRGPVAARTTLTDEGVVVLGDVRVIQLRKHARLLVHGAGGVAVSMRRQARSRPCV